MGWSRRKRGRLSAQSPSVSNTFSTSLRRVSGLKYGTITGSECDALKKGWMGNKRMKRNVCLKNIWIIEVIRHSFQELRAHRPPIQCFFVCRRCCFLELIVDDIDVDTRSRWSGWQRVAFRNGPSTFRGSAATRKMNRWRPMFAKKKSGYQLVD